jgi:hypothetical protein
MRVSYVYESVYNLTETVFLHVAGEYLVLAMFFTARYTNGIDVVSLGYKKRCRIAL